jgi:hypothetical protein
MKPKEYRTILETQYEVQNYKGVLLQKNPMTNSWYIFFEDQKTPPMYGKNKEVKEIIDNFETRGMLDVLKKY